MKLLIMLMVVVACGKNTEPLAQDLRDSDGDRVANAVDIDKYRANIVPVEPINAELEFITGEPNLTRHKFNLKNNVDIKTYSKDLLVNPPVSTPDRDFFSESSVLNLISSNPVVMVEDSIKIHLKFSKISSVPSSILLVSKDKKKKLSDWRQELTVSITKKEMEAILAKKSFLTLSYNDPIEEVVKSKTYRLFYSDGERAEIAYISKELSVKQVLGGYGITEYNLIQDVNLLTTTIEDNEQEWWVRVTKNNEIIVIKENMKELSAHFIKDLHKTSGVAIRSNGFNAQTYAFNQLNVNRILLKVRVEQRMANFLETPITHWQRIPGSNPTDHECYKNHTRSFSGEYLADPSQLDILSQLLINGLYITQQAKNISMRKAADESGLFWEIEIVGLNHVELSFVELPQSSYQDIGVYKRTKCNKKAGTDINNNNPQTPERSLTLKIETFVENIRE